MVAVQREAEVLARLGQGAIVDGIRSDGQGGILAYRYRSACQMCALPVAQGADVNVAVIDTGVDYTHPDLVANIWTNPGEIPDNGIDDDENGSSVILKLRLIE